MKSENNLLVSLPLSDLSTTPFYVMPPGLLSLAAYMRENNLSTDLLDLNIIKKKNVVNTASALMSMFENYLAENRPCLVGASVMVAGQFKLAREVSKATKQFSSDAVTVVGGAHVSQFPREILENCPEIDFVVMGEGESQALACAHFARTKESPSVWPDGMAYRSNGKIVVKPKSSYIESLDALPFPAYDLVEFDDYLHDTSRWHNPYQVDLGVRVPIITSRGCPNLCNFCSVAKCMGLSYRPMSSAKVVDMMQMLHEQNDVRCFAIFDANFAQEPHRVIEICNEISRRNLKFYIDLPTGLPINTTAREMIDALAEVGLIRTCISVETGDANIRNSVMIKNIEQDEIFKVVEAVRRHPQIFLMTDFVMGMPEDTVESLEASCELIANLDTDDITLSIATPYPGTELYHQCVREKLFAHEVEKEKLWMADWYTHANTNMFVIKPYELDMKTLGDYRDRIIAERDVKIASYRKRMKEVFNIDSEYRRV
jgi:magnesium-protoporphyrin IX monomethyl ester (oxidative) cyclase